MRAHESNVVAERIAMRTIRGGILLLSVVLLMPTDARAQWINSYTPDGLDGDLIFMDLERDPNPDSNVWVVTGMLDNEFLVGLLDFGGNLIWSSTYGEGEGKDVFVLDTDDAATHFVVAGGGFGTSGVLMEFEVAVDELLLVKRCEGGPRVLSAVQANDGSLVAVGRWLSYPSAYKTVAGPGGNISCGVDWSFEFPDDDLIGSTDFDGLHKIRQLSSGDFVAVGTMDQNGVGEELSEGIVVKFDEDGVIDFVTKIKDYGVDPDEVYNGLNLFDVVEMDGG